MFKQKAKLSRNAAKIYARFIFIKTSSFLDAVYVTIYDSIPKAYFFKGCHLRLAKSTQSCITFNSFLKFRIMAKIKRLFKSFSRLLLPVILLIVLAFAAASAWLNYEAAQPPKGVYLVTPEKYGQLSARAAQVTDETWTGMDGNSSRGWLLRGAENAPAVILLHRYGTDRSHVLNMGVKLSESTNFTVLMPDARAHGENPTAKNTSFGGCETQDVVGAIEFLRGLRAASGNPLVGQNLGVYGIEMGALTALAAAGRDEKIKAIALDSIPQDSDNLLASVIEKRFPFASSITSKLAQTGTYFYPFGGCYRRETTCEIAKNLNNRNVLLLAGSDAPRFQDSTAKLGKCFPKTSSVESKTDLSPSGFSIINASMEQSESYDQRVIEFFRLSLGNQ
jgi:pimeloyl-ACP methyl ester carboxylesterase